MKIVVIGGTGFIGSRLVTTLRENGHWAVAASPESGVDTVTGENLPEVLEGATVVVDVSAPPSCGSGAVAECFATSTRNILGYAAEAGVTHHVALSSVGAGGLLESGYFQARGAQERLIKESPIPYSIVRATPCFESLGTITGFTMLGEAVHVPPVIVQPVAADDVVRVLAAIATAAPLYGTIEIGGPEPFPLDGLVQRVLGACGDSRAVTADANARYFGARLDERSLVADDEAELGEIRFEDWLRHAPLERAPTKAHEFRVSDVPPGSVLLMGEVAVFSVAGGFAATQAMCTHKAGPLSEGTVDDTTVTCPLHGSQFNIWTGAVLRGPAKEPLKTYRVIVDGEIGCVETEVTTVGVE
jgi:uncharacterized protein YbjT (DUF2867 family)/nitrite reductase/ring-hydroxylating ferredoxin subunit